MTGNIPQKTLPPEQQEALLKTLGGRFEKNKARHENISWEDVLTKLALNPTAIWSISRMEETGGEPDVIGSEGLKIIFCDCSKESPEGRRNVCYDRAALESRKKFKPQNNAVDMADEMGIELLSEEQYRDMQKLGEFDTKTSSWITTPEQIRKLGGALFCDRRYDTVFVYHNGADSYYAVRGFRGRILI